MLGTGLVTECTEKHMFAHVGLWVGNSASILAFLVLSPHKPKLRPEVFNVCLVLYGIFI